jgi:hypothetical protein
MKLHPVGGELFDVDGRTDGERITSLPAYTYQKLSALFTQFLFILVEFRPRNDHEILGAFIKTLQCERQYLERINIL